MKILAIDFNALFRRSWESSGGKELSEAYSRTLQTVASIREGFDRVAILCDSGPSFRKALLSTYKADREKPPAPFYDQMRRTVMRLMQDGCVPFVAPAIQQGTNDDPVFAEADDLCASLATWCLSHGHRLVIFGGDKDLLQCAERERDTGGPVDVWRPDHDGLWNPSRVEAYPKIGLSPERVPDWLALGGDKTDGFKMFQGWTDYCECVSGSPDLSGEKRAACKTCKGKGTIDRPGIGPGHASKLLQKFGTILGVVDAAMSDADPPPFAPGHLRDVIRRAKPSPVEAAQLGLRLATLVQDLPVDWSVLEREPEAQSIVEDRKPMAPPVDAEEIDEEPSAALATVESRGGISRFGEHYKQAEQMMDLAEKFFEGRFFGSFPNPQSLFTVMWLAAERGDNVGHALVNSYVTKSGKPPGYLAVYLAARVKTSGLCKVLRIVETTDDHATLEYQREDDPDPMRYTFKLKEAETAGWIRPDSPWQTRPRAMLRNAVMREVCKFHWPEVCAGMNDADEDMR